MENQEGKSVLLGIEFPVRIEGDWQKLNTDKLFKGKRIVLFSLPGAFTPTCSSTHLPRYEELYPVFKENGIDEIYCVAVNDTFVMSEWAKCQGVKNIKMLPDGNCKFTQAMGMLVDKEDLGFGKRSWRYSMLVEDGKIIKHFIEPDKEGDPFEVSDADTMLKAINPEIQLPQSVTLFSKEGCPFCHQAKELLDKKGIAYSEVMLPDATRQKVLSGLTGNSKPTAPQIFIDGTLIGGTEELKMHLNQ